MGDYYGGMLRGMLGVETIAHIGEANLSHTMGS